MKRKRMIGEVVVDLVAEQVKRGRDRQKPITRKRGSAPAMIEADAGAGEGVDIAGTGPRADSRSSAGPWRERIRGRSGSGWAPDGPERRTHGGRPPPCK